MQPRDTQTTSRSRRAQEYIRKMRFNEERIISCVIVSSAQIINPTLVLFGSLLFACSALY